ncbi:hypothetical protein VDG1235_3570 [Verrucomicrobiia bacterium DG1235]|nr:hypothetical protein VDG1235_3570 [Verrucomicrobiae bacterium DG1235]
MGGARECVVLLHGLARTKRSMEPMRRFLEKHGFETLNLGYPSTRLTVEECAGLLRPRIVDAAERGGSLHFVTHSMGGIVLRELQAVAPIPNLGRCVMLSPPNQGSHVVDRLGGWAPFGWLNGPAGRQLGTGRDSTPNRLGEVDFEVGVLTGDRSVNWILSLMISGPNDGKVAVSHAEVAGRAAFKVLHATHPFIMRNAKAQANTLAFLRSGAFLSE